MRAYLSILLFIVTALSVSAQGPIQRNHWTTNLNPSLVVTNDCQVTGENTNVIVVVSAGTAAANGTYKHKTTGGGLTVWTNSANGSAIVHDDAELDPIWLTNSAGTTLYYNSTPAMETTWTVGSGGSPAPTVSFLDVTNCRTYVVATGTNILESEAMSTAYYIDSTIGSDAWGERGHPEKPWLTFSGALADGATTNDVIIFSAGQHDIGGTATLLPGMKIFGAGRGITTVTNASTAYFWQLDDNVVISDISLNHALYMDSVTAPTNVLIANTAIYGPGGDAIFAKKWGSITIVNCRFDSLYDCFADYMPASNAVCRVYNSEFISRYNAGGNTLIRGVMVRSNAFLMYGGSITASNGVTNAAVVFDGAAGSPAVIELYGVALYHGSTNGNSFAVTNTAIGNGIMRGNWSENGATFRVGNTGRSSIAMATTNGNYSQTFLGPLFHTNDIYWIFPTNYLPSASATNLTVTQTTGPSGITNTVSLGASSGGSGTPAGSDGQIQYNDGGAFGAEAPLAWDKDDDQLDVTGSISATGSWIISGLTASRVLALNSSKVAVDSFTSAVLKDTLTDEFGAAGGKALFATFTSPAAGQLVGFSDASTLVNVTGYGKAVLAGFSNQVSSISSTARSVTNYNYSYTNGALLTCSAPHLGYITNKVAGDLDVWFQGQGDTGDLTCEVYTNDVIVAPQQGNTLTSPTRGGVASHFWLPGIAADVGINIKVTSGGATSLTRYHFWIDRH